MFTFTRKTTLSLLALVLGLMMLALAACSNSPAALSAVSGNSLAGANISSNSSYRFKTLDDKADPTFNQLLGINNYGVISGYFGSGADAAHPNKGYVLYPPYGQHNYKNENFPGSVQTQVTAINNHGDTAGFWVDAKGNSFGFVKHNGVFTSYTDPKSVGGTLITNQLLGINDYGVAVGFYTDANGNNHAYKLTLNNRHFTELVPPGSTSATATAINDNGDILGFFVTTNKSTEGFLRYGPKKSYKEFSVFGSTNVMALGINNYDQIVGVYTDGANNMHGFLLSSPLSHSKVQSIDDPNGVGTTTINGLNDKGQLVGFYMDAQKNTHGFLASK